MKNFRGKGFSKTKSYMDDTTYGYQGKPSKEEDVKIHMSVKSLRDLPKSSYAVKADPYEAALPTSEPYPFINKFNKVVGANYAGDDNIDGGNVQQYANSSVSLFLKIFDIIRTKVNLNYRYLPMSRRYKVVATGTTLAAGKIYWKKTSGVYRQATDGTAAEVTAGKADYEAGVTTAPASTYYVSEWDSVGRALIDEMRKSIAEATSVLKATTFYQMAINDFVVATDLPMGSAKAIKKEGATGEYVYVYTDIADVIYAMSIYYQLFLQDTLNVMNWHNSFRMKQGVMIRNGWNREVPNLNGFFGLMNKKAFLNKLQSINLSFEGEYIDKDFMEQINILSFMPSRRSDSMLDPVMELQIGFNHPTTFTVGIKDVNGDIAANLFDDAALSFTVNVNGTPQTMSIWDICDALRDDLSMEKTVLWARQKYAGGVVTTDNDRFNTIISYFQAISQAFVVFKPLWADYRAAIDVVSRPGIVNWTKGFRPSITKDTDGKLFDVMIINDVFNFLIAGPAVVDYDDVTKRWRTFTKWNMYHGVPECDTKSGGSFLSFAFKDWSGVLTNEQIEYIPQLFSYSSSGAIVAATSRDGVEYAITGGSSDVVTISNVPILKRIAPLASQASLQIRVPTVAYDASNDAGHLSFLYKMLTQLFGICRIEIASGVYDYAIDPDVVAIYQIEVADITNMAITYARVNAPFRGTSSGDDQIGFSSKVV